MDNSVVISGGRGGVEVEENRAMNGNGNNKK